MWPLSQRHSLESYSKLLLIYCTIKNRNVYNYCTILDRTVITVNVLSGGPLSVHQPLDVLAFVVRLGELISDPRVALGVQESSGDESSGLCVSLAYASGRT